MSVAQDKNDEGYDYGFADGGSDSARYSSSPSNPDWEGDALWLDSYDMGYDDGVRALAALNSGDATTIGSSGVTKEGAPAVVTKSDWGKDLVAVIDSVGKVIGYGKQQYQLPKSSNRLTSTTPSANTGIMVVGGVLLLGLAYAASRKGK